MNERILKRGALKILDPRLWKQVFFNLRFCNKLVYFLSIGNYAANDILKLGFNSNHIYQFGYFPKTKHYNNIISHKNQDEILRCIWVGRLIHWKRPLDVLESFKSLPKERIHLTILGDGPMMKILTEKISQERHSNVTLKGIVPLDQVREEMLSSDVFISTSTKQEGWGAVLNEAMNSGCALICSNEVGAAPNLVDDGVNGFLYSVGNSVELVEKLEVFSNNKSLAHEMGQEGYKKIVQLWNEDVAADRLLQVCDKLLAGKEIAFSEGPLSKVFN